ncbi:MAG: 16S rRNA (adenine(1518)-N(6)/adenine(1519)-N(6))-dimethyltransferase RsmA [Acidobacteriota bacterium]
MPTQSKLGQNFLCDAQAADRIVAAMGDLVGRTVVEIGPGRGAITAGLAGRAGHVLAIELDRQLAAGLRGRFPAERVTVIEKDVLDFDFAGAAEQAGERLRVAGNLPYYITSPILLKLAASHAALESAVLMVQREVAERVTAAPGTRDYGILSISAQMHGPAEPLFTLPPSAFSPPPEVYSTVFRWRFAPRFAELGVEPAGFQRFVRVAFAQKRKTFANNLRAAGIPAPAAAAAMDAAAVGRQARSESLPIETLAALWRALDSAGALPGGETKRSGPSGADFGHS